jgi:tripartite-type tricarboxylate transporter receptor subunit TctC
MSPLLRLFPLLAAAVAFAATLAADTLHAQPRYPDKPLRLVVGFASGGAADTVARVLADQLGKQLNQTVIVDNRTGASGNIATQAVLAAPADGYTLMFAGLQLATNPAMMKAGYNPEQDIQMVTQFNSLPVVLLVRADSPWQTMTDVTAAMKNAAARGGLAFGSGGIGTSSHLAAEQLSRVTGAPFTHVPFRGGALATQALLAGDVQLMFDLMSGSLKGMIDAKKVRPIAVMQERRATELPNVPSAGEQGMKSEVFMRTWQGLAVKSGTPPEIVNRLFEAVQLAVRSPAVAERFADLGMETTLSRSPADAQAFYLGELARWGALIKAANIKAE